jgi:hypothetical protein
MAPASAQSLDYSARENHHRAKGREIVEFDWFYKLDISVLYAAAIFLIAGAAEVRYLGGPAPLRGSRR